MRVYKLTNGQHQTKNHAQWGEGVTHGAPGQGDLCSAAYLHAYKSPFMAVFFAPIHLNFPSYVLWEAEGEVEKDDGLKLGCTSLTTQRVMPLPEMSTAARVRVAIECALLVCQDFSFQAWAHNWLTKQDRSWTAARAALAAAEAAVWAVWAAAWAARAALAEAARAWAALAAARAARAVEEAALAAEKTFDLDAIIRRAIGEES